MCLLSPTALRKQENTDRPLSFPDSTGMPWWRGRDQLWPSAFLPKGGSCGGLRDDSHLFLGKCGKTWRRQAFNDKKYETSVGEVATTKDYGSLENLVRGLLKGAGLNYSLSHLGS